MTNIAITDDEALFRAGLKMIVEDIEDMSVLFEAENGQVLLDKLLDRKTNGLPLPDLLLLDLQMPVLNGIETAKQLQEKYPDIKFIVLSTHFSKAFIINMIEIGASSYLPKNTRPDVMEKTIEMVAEKGFYYSDEVMKVIHENMKSKSKSKAKFGNEITEREREILQLICQQFTANEIAAKLFISRRTVEGHRNNLLAKLNCKNIAGLVAYAIQNELVNINPSQFWSE